MLGLLITSALASGFLLVTWTVFPHMRKNQLIYYVVIALFVLALVFTGTWLVPPGPGRTRGMRNTMCKDNTQMTTFRDGGYCLFQGLTLLFSSLVAIFFWFLQSFDLFTKIVLEWSATPAHEATRSRWYFCLGWGLPLLSTCIAAATESIADIVSLG